MTYETGIQYKSLHAPFFFFRPLYIPVIYTDIWKHLTMSLIINQIKQNQNNCLDYYHKYPNERNVSLK